MKASPSAKSCVMMVCRCTKSAKNYFSDSMSNPFYLGKSEKIEPGGSLLIPQKERTRLIVDFFY